MENVLYVKECKNCHKELLLSHFYTSGKKSKTIRPVCKGCTIINQKRSAELSAKGLKRCRECLEIKNRETAFQTPRSFRCNQCADGIIKAIIFDPNKKYQNVPGGARQCDKCGYMKASDAYPTKHSPICSGCVPKIQVWPIPQDEKVHEEFSPSNSPQCSPRRCYEIPETRPTTPNLDEGIPIVQQPTFFPPKPLQDPPEIPVSHPTSESLPGIPGSEDRAVPATIVEPIMVDISKMTIQEIIALVQREQQLPVRGDTAEEFAKRRPLPSNLQL